MMDFLDLAAAGEPTPPHRTAIADPAEHGDLAWIMSLLVRPSGACGEVRIRGGRNPDPGGPSYVVLPTTSAPRLIMSEGLPTHAVRGHADPTNLKALLKRRAMQAAASSLGRRVVGTRVHVTGDPARLDDHLGEIAGHEHPHILVRPGEPGRANRKPIVQVVDPHSGQTVAWVKIGWNDLTTRLVRGEARSLALGDDPYGQIVTPRVIDCGRWHGLDLFVTEPLPPAHDPVELIPIRHAALVLEVARRGLGTTKLALCDTPWAATWTSRVAAAPTSVRGELLTLGAELFRSRGEDQLLIGTWHGDWTPWNMHVGPRRVQVWDWERSAPGVPVGLDVHHHGFQQALLTAGNAVEEAVQLSRTATAPVFEHLDVGPPDLVEIAYLLEIAARWSEDVHLPSGAWLQPHLDALVMHLRGRIWT